MELIFASQNHHKKEELAALLAPHSLLLPEQLGVHYHCEETGRSYFENALAKAMQLYRLCRRPVLADDSGLSVEALHGAPGIYSARFGSRFHQRLSDREKCSLLLKRMSRTADRKAFFVCNLVLLINPYRFYSVQETLNGEIAAACAGSNGFGYDPVFFLPDYGKTAAQLSAEEKNALSHRGKAARRLGALIDSLPPADPPPAAGKSPKITNILLAGAPEAL